MYNVSFAKPIPSSIKVCKNLLSFKEDETPIFSVMLCERDINGRAQFGWVAIYRYGFVVTPAVGPGIPYRLPWSVIVEPYTSENVLFQVLELASSMTGIDMFDEMEKQLNLVTDFEKSFC